MSGDRAQVNFRIDREAWREVRLSAARQDMKLNEWMTEAMNEKLDREQQKLMNKLLGNSEVDNVEPQP